MRCDIIKQDQIKPNRTKVKAIKNKYDPTRMFRVWNGVGGTRPETGSEHVGL